MAEVNLTLGDPIEVKVAPAEGATNVTVSPAPQNIVQVQAAIATNGLAGADGAGVPSDPAGKEGQALVKSSDVAQETEWAYIEKLHITVKNETGSTIPEGSAVYASGISGNNILVGLADASNPNTMPAIGITNEEITDNSTGDLISSGLINKTLTGFSGVSVGDTVYVSETAGEVTTTKPSGTALIQNIGVVLKTNGNNIQKMKVSSIDRVNDIPNLASGKIFLGGASGQVSPYELPITSPSNDQLLVANGSGNFTYEDSSDFKENLATANLTSTGSRSYRMANGSRLTFQDNSSTALLVLSNDARTVGVGNGASDELLHVHGNAKVDGNIIVSGTVDGKDVSTLISSINEDSAPRLSARLDLSGQGIVDATGIDLNDDVFIPTSSLQIGSTSSAEESLHITNGTLKIDNGVSPYVFPTADGSANQVLTTDGSGQLSFSDSGSGETYTISAADGDNADEEKIVLTDSQSGTDEVVLEAGTGLSISRAEDKITFANTLTDTNTSLGDTDQTLDDDRDIDIDGNTLSIVNGASNIATFSNSGLVSVDGAFLSGQYNTSGNTTGLNSAGDFADGCEVLTKFGTTTTGMSAGDVYYYSGTWVAARSDTVGNASKLLAVASDTSSSSPLVTRGVVRVANNSGFSSASSGEVLYLDSTGGRVSVSAPTSGVVRVVGYVVDNSNSIIYFDPSKDWIEL